MLSCSVWRKAFNCIRQNALVTEMKDKMCSKNILSKCETSCTAEKIEVTDWKKVSVYLITSEFEPSSYNGIHVTKSPPQKQCWSFHGLCR